LVSYGELRTLAIFDKPDPLVGPIFEESIYVTPSRLPLPAQGSVVSATSAAVRALGLVQGPIHAEIRVDASQARVVEIAPRPIGGLCSRALRFGFGVSLEAVILAHALGRSEGALERESAASGVMMIPIPAAGTLCGVTGVERASAIAGIDGIRITIPIGGEVVPLPEGSRYLGFIFARADDPGAVEKALREAHRCLSFDIQAPAPAAPYLDEGAANRT
jgi:hypothetical protein